MHGILLCFVVLFAALNSPSFAGAAEGEKPTPPEWKGEFHGFPAILETWHLACRLERDGAGAVVTRDEFIEASREGNLPLAAVLYHHLVLHNRGELFWDDVEFGNAVAIFRHAAREYLRAPTERWSAEILLQRALTPLETRGTLATLLLPHFQKDDIPFNASRSAEFYIAGLRKNRDAFLPPLLDRLARVTHADRDEQEELFLLSLALGVLIHEPTTYADRSETFWSITRIPGHPFQVDFSDLDDYWADALVHSSAKLQGNGHWRPGDQVPRERLHMMARIYLEEVFPRGRDLLSQAVLTGKLRQYDAIWVLGLHLDEDPDLFFEQYGEILVECIRQSHFHCYSNAPCAEDYGRLFVGNSRYGRRLYRGNTLFYSPSRWHLENRWPNFNAYRSRARTLLWNAIQKERDTDKQFYLIHTLAEIGGMDDSDLWINLLITHMADDYTSLNAGFSREQLERIGEAAIPHLEAGLQVAVELGDWQLIGKCNLLLHQICDDYDPSEWSEVHEFLWEQLRDDTIFGNGTAAYHYFASWGEGALEYMRSKENPDWQQRSYIQRLENHLGQD